MKQKYKINKKKLSTQDNNDIDDICELYEKKHKDVANIVYKDEIKKITTLSLREKMPDILEQYLISKYQAVCKMIEAMHTYIKYYNKNKSKKWIFDRYMKDENPADWVTKNTRPIDHYYNVFKIVFSKHKHNNNVIQYKDADGYVYLI